MMQLIMSLYKILCFLLWVAGVFSVKFNELNFVTNLNKFPLNTILNITTSLQPKCRNSIEKLFQKIEKHDLNSLKMLDAIGKLPSGILSGNINQYGDFDECMEVKEAQYCLVEIDLEPIWQDPYKKFKNLVHSFYAFKESMNDPGHRVPGFSFVRWGFCIPHDCSDEDLTKSLKENFNVTSRILPGMCQKTINETPKDWTFGDYFARFFFVAIGIAVILSSSIDSFKNYGIINDMRFISRNNSSNVMKILMCFSIERNFQTLTNINDTQNKNEIKGVHGIRLLSAFGLLMSHKSVALFFNPYINRTSTIQRLMRPWTIIAKNAIIYTDSFMLISGLLNANALFTDLIQLKSMNFRQKIINRLFRIVPNLISLILFCTYVLPYSGAGPLWPTVVTHHSNLCKKFMWRNLFFIHNYFEFENMCLTHTHQLGIDMQLFLATPVFVYVIWKFKQIGLILLMLTATMSTILRFWITYEHELSTVIYFGIPVNQMIKTANLSYILPTHRATIYLIGVYLAYYLKQCTPSHVPNKFKQLLIWAAFLVPFFYSWFGPYYMTSPDFVYDKLDAAIIAAFSPIVFGAAVAFAIYVLNRHLHVYGIIGKGFCWKYWQIGTKLSYAIYLVQFPVYFYNVGVTKHSDQYHPYYQILETTVIFLCSFILVLFIELPFQSMHRILFLQKVNKVKRQECCLRKSKYG